MLSQTLSLQDFDDILCQLYSASFILPALFCSRA
jgi:hypothetical protein